VRDHLCNTWPLNFLQDSGALQEGGVKGMLVQCMPNEIPSTGLNKGREYIEGVS
jgi:hypothetical protein